MGRPDKRLAVGYIGCAQYRGDFHDAERSLCANWERIKCDSRLSLEEAVPAMRISGIFKQGALIGDGSDRDPLKLLG